MLKIGLTGGIGSGKSTAAKYFSRLNIPVVDADKIVHELLKSNTSIYKKIVAHLGKKFLTHRKTIDRAKLSQWIFSHKKERMWLEKLIHPRVRAEILKRITLFNAPYCIVVVPLLFETKFPPKVDRILLIDCPKKTQISRVHNRKRYSTSQIKAIIAAQANRKERFKQADDIICNAGTLAAFKKKIKKIHNYYLNLV